MKKILPKKEPSKFFKAPRYLFRKHNIMHLTSSIDVDSFLDVGCGAGELACSMAENGLNGVGIDFSKDAIAVADKIRLERGIKKKNLRFKLGGLETVKGDVFDMVCCFEVLEHVENDEGLLAELIKKSKKYVLLSVPAKQRLYDVSDEAVGHYRRYEKDAFIQTLMDADLKVVHFINYGYPFTNLVRIMRKLQFNISFSKNKNQSMEKRSKNSGINPIKAPPIISSLDTEKIIKPFYWVSKIFNRYDLSEGYLVLCEKTKAQQ